MRELSQRIGVTLKTEKWWLPPLAFWVAATGFVAAHAWLAWGTYMRAGLVRWPVVPSLFAALYLEFAVTAIVVTWLYRRGWPRVVAAVLTLLLLLVNSAQLIANVYSSEFINAAVVRLAPLIGQVVSIGSVAMLGFGVLASSTLLFAALRFGRWSTASVRARVLATLTCVAWGFVMNQCAHSHAADDVSARFGLRPEAPVLSLVRAVRESFGTAESATPPSAAEIKLAARAGISIAPNAITPFRKEWIYRRPLPFEKQPGATSRPNVIVFFFESWSAEVLGPYNPKLTAVTPNLNDFAPHAMRVDDYVNHTIPTVTGLRGQLCSMFPSLSYTPWRKAEKPRVGRVLCLPRLLGDFGYDSVYLNHGPAELTHFDSQAIDWGFKHAYFRDFVFSNLLNGAAPENGSEASDQQMMRATIELLKRRRSRASSKPLFLAVSTVETHTGHHTKLTFGNGKNRVLNTFYNLDNAFGIFWDWYKNSEWAKDTIVILTGDHVLYPQDDLRRVATPRHLNARFGYLGLFIMDPTHKLPPSFAVKSSSLDFAPTLIQLLDLPANQPNPFLGLSMFSDRQVTPLALGFNYGKELLVWDRERPAPDLYNMPESGDPRALFNVLHYAEALENSNRMWLQ